MSMQGFIRGAGPPNGPTSPPALPPPKTSKVISKGVKAIRIRNGITSLQGFRSFQWLKVALVPEAGGPVEGRGAQGETLHNNSYNGVTIEFLVY